jgi:hypothetical protein
VRRVVAACLIGAIALAIVAASNAHHAGLHLTVTPAVGHPFTRFVVAFTAPQAVGGGSPPRSGYDVSATEACGQDGGSGSPPVGRGRRVRVTLRPAAAGPKPWCLGIAHGRLRVWHLRTCQRKCAGPVFKTLARFSFSVVAPQQADTTPPTFAGLESAFACTPGAQYPGETTPFTLTWHAASDNVTPSSRIVYDIYMSTTSGGEDFSHPAWTTAPGVAGFRTPGLASHGTFYFVVRARDQAGNEDRNGVERRGVDPCL